MKRVDVAVIGGGNTGWRWQTASPRPAATSFSSIRVSADSARSPDAIRRRCSCARLRSSTRCGAPRSMESKWARSPSIGSVSGNPSIPLRIRCRSQHEKIVASAREISAAAAERRRRCPLRVLRFRSGRLSPAAESYRSPAVPSCNLLTIDFDRYERRVHQLADGGIRERLRFHDMAPVTRRIADRGRSACSPLLLFGRPLRPSRRDDS